MVPDHAYQIYNTGLGTWQLSDIAIYTMIGAANFFCKGLDSTYLRLFIPYYSLYYNCTTLSCSINIAIDNT